MRRDNRNHQWVQLELFPDITSNNEMVSVTNKIVR